MIENALTDVGGTKYLRQQAHENPVAFLTLVGKLLPKNMSVQTDANVNVRKDLIDRAIALMQGNRA